MYSFTDDHDAYLNRKHDELVALNAGLLDRLDIPDKLSFDEIIDLKVKIRSRYWIRSITEYPYLMESNLTSSKEMSYFDYRLSFWYQRSDLQVFGLPVYGDVLASLSGRPEDLIVDTVFTSSGMGAVCSAIVTLASVVKPRTHMVALKDCFFETQQILRYKQSMLQLSLADSVVQLKHAVDKICRSGEEGVILLVDSIGAVDVCSVLQGTEGLRFDMILFDTTCYEVSSTRIEYVVRTAMDRGIPLVLLRSHLKLDWLGIEYARLGSSVFLLGQNTDSSRSEFFRSFVGKCGQTVRLFGLTAFPHHLPPFGQDSRLAELNRMRLAKTEDNNLWAARRLRDSLPAELFHVVGYHHGMFFTMELVGRSPYLLHTEISRLAAFASDLGLPVRNRGSFGLDFITIDDFVDFVRETLVLRISVSDQPKDIVRAFCDALAQWCVSIDISVKHE